MSLTDYDKASFSRSTGKAAADQNETIPDAATNNDHDNDNSTTRVELIEVTEKERQGGENPILTLTNSFNRAREDTGRYNEYALRLVLKLDKNGDAIGTELEIRSWIIRRALKSILATYAFLNLAASPIVIKKPYDALFHYRKEIAAYSAAPERSTVEKQHMKVLTDFITLYIGPTEKIYMEEVPKGRIRFELLWTLFRAEDDIVVQTEYFREIHRMVHCEQKKDKNDEKYFQLHTWRWGYNAGKFGPAAETLIIPHFSSSRRITQLPYFPVKLLEHKHQDALHHKLVARGHDWRNLIRPTHRMYNGPMWIDPPERRPNNKSELIINYIKGRIMLDQKLHVEANFQLADHLIGANGYSLGSEERDDESSTFRVFFGERVRPLSREGNGKKCILNNVRCYEDNKEYVMTDEEAWLSPARVRGFSLSEKRWAFFLVEKITQIAFREEAFQQLEMDSLVKETVQALVEMHSRSPYKFDDFVAGKGKGCIMSLGGPPGAGKTLTAESIAELTHKPLYAISTGELSSNIEYAEPVLRQIFARATAWDAVLLLDEADLFLTKRTSNDIKRNAFVTVFLRLLEYYQGIMFLTSNRVEEFDPAFHSRIHLKVAFEAPDALRRASIWRNLLREIDDTLQWDLTVFEALGRDLDLNGREIKNLISPALAIAAFKKKPLTDDILRLVYSINHRRTSVNSG